MTSARAEASAGKVRSLKVLQVVASVNLRTGGPAHTVPALARALGAAGVDSVLASLNYEALGPQPALEFYSAVSQPASAGARYLRGWSPAFRRQLLRLATEGVSLVHGHGLWMFPNLYARQAAVRAKLPLVVSPRGMLEGWALERSAIRKAVVWHLFERANLQHAAMFHATSMQEAESIRVAGFRQPIACIPNGVTIPADSSAIERAVLENVHRELRGRRWMLFMSRLHPKKDVASLLRAWAAMQHLHPDWQLLIAGDSLDGYSAVMQQLARELGLQGRVTFAGMLSDARKACALGHAELFVLPTLSENFGIAVAEALAYGIPVITTRAAPWPELEAHRCGWWIDVGEESLRTALAVALAAGEPERREMGARGRALANTRYGWTGIASEMIAAYRWLLGDGVAPSCLWSGA